MNKDILEAALKNPVPCSGIEEAELIVNDAVAPAPIIIPAFSVTAEDCNAVLDLVRRGEGKGVLVLCDEYGFLETKKERDLMLEWRSKWLS
jgi:hypothetical protein